MQGDQDQPSSAVDNEDMPYPGEYAGSWRDEAEFELTRLLSIAARRWGTHVESRMLAKTGQSRSRWQTLFVLNVAEPPITTSLLAERLAIQWPPLIRTLHALEADGLVRRYANPHDRRSRYIEITEAGRAVVKQVHPALSDIRAEVLSALTEDEIRTTMRMLDKILHGVSNAKP